MLAIQPAPWLDTVAPATAVVESFFNKTDDAQPLGRPPRISILLLTKGAEDFRRAESTIQLQGCKHEAESSTISKEFGY